jgi:hypothetical protein
MAREPSRAEPARELRSSRAEPLSPAREMDEPSRAELVLSPSRAELGSARFQPYVGSESDPTYKWCFRLCIKDMFCLFLHVV